MSLNLEVFKLAVENASEHIIITDAEGIVLYANKVTETITGYLRPEIIGKKVGTLWSRPMPKEYYEKLWRKIKVEKQPFISHINNRRKNGEEYTAEIRISPVLDDKGNVIFFVGIERDITKEQEVDKAKTEFVSLASHQLRTPLSAINWYAEMLLAGDAGKLSADQKKYLEEIYKGNQRMVGLVNALLNVSRLELGTFMIEPESIVISEIAQSVAKELKPQIQEKKIDYQEKLEKIPAVMADPKLLRIVFQNLLSNAVKYTPEKGKVVLELKTVKQDEAIAKHKIAEDSILLTVTDTGYGIPEKQKDKIFEKLFRADNVRIKETEGTGLGLYIVKAIIDQAKGQVWFESVENKGTTFYATLPRSGMKPKEGTKTLD